jgi:hypothetical protein
VNYSGRQCLACSFGNIDAQDAEGEGYEPGDWPRTGRGDETSSGKITLGPVRELYLSSLLC